MRNRMACLTRLCLPVLLLAARAPGAVLVDDVFRSPGKFSYRTIFDSVPDRLDNWAVKMTDLPDGRILMVWCSTSGRELSPTNRLWMAFSSDRGRTWSRERLFAESRAGRSVLNPTVYRHTDGGVFVFYNAGNGTSLFEIAYRVSRDSGKTWGGEQVMPVGEDVTSLMSNPIRLRDGSILLPTSYNRERRSPGHWTGTVLLSRDGGRSWTRGGDFPVSVQRGAMEPSIVQLASGRLYGLIRTKSGYQYETRSDDGGLTWQAPKPSPFPSPESTGILTRLAGGGLLFVWNRNRVSDGRQVPRYPLFAALSEDEGQSWPHQKMIETTYGNHQLSNHGVIETSPGSIVVVTNHYQGAQKGSDTGLLQQASFDLDWLRSGFPADRWDGKAAETGGLRLDSDGLLIASGGKGETSLLVSRTPLPASGTLEVEIGDSSAGCGLFLDDASKPAVPVPAKGRLRIEIQDSAFRGSGRSRIELNRKPGGWGLGCSGQGEPPPRMKVRRIRLTETQPRP